VVVRLTAQFLVVFMLLASGRLLACGLECAGVPAPAAEASCHQPSAHDASLSAAASHTCLPDIAEPRVTGTKPVSVHAMASPLVLVTALVSSHSPAVSLRSPVNSIEVQFAAPRSLAPFVLRL
jgi:hypothetical protein